MELLTCVVSQDNTSLSKSRNKENSSVVELQSLSRLALPWNLEIHPELFISLQGLGVIQDGELGTNCGGVVIDWQSHVE